MQITIMILLVCTLLITPHAFTSEKNIREITYLGGLDDRDSRPDFFKLILDLALSKSDLGKEGYRLTPQGRFSVNRSIRALQEGQLDVIPLSVQSYKHPGLQPVPIPIYRGLIGWRLLIINARDSAQFEAVNNIDDLRKLRAGFGYGWSDLSILEKNVGEVVTGSYLSLFRMLNHGRFDYFHRAIYEPLEELKVRKQILPGLQIEPTLLIHYHHADLFYVRESDQALARYIQQGFENAIADGSYYALFKRYVEPLLGQLKLNERTVLSFDTAPLPAALPYADSAFWFSPIAPNYLVEEDSVPLLEPSDTSEFIIAPDSE